MVGPARDVRGRLSAYPTAAVGRPRVATLSRWSAGTTAEDSAVQQDGQQYCRNTTGATVTIDALLDIVAEPEPTFGKLLARKAELIVERAADWVPAR